MKLGDGVEQSIHTVDLLCGLEPGEVMPASAIAEFIGCAATYLLKHLQAMSRDGILQSVSGPKGGYRLGRSPELISLLDIVLAVEGRLPAFRCSEIRRRGPAVLPGTAFVKPCAINIAMLEAERVYREELARTTVASIASEHRQEHSEIRTRICTFLEHHKRPQNSK